VTPLPISPIGSRFTERRRKTAALKRFQRAIGSRSLVTPSAPTNSRKTLNKERKSSRAEILIAGEMKKIPEIHNPRFWAPSQLSLDW
jgi:hypothetical protein